jgi:hypothetical protein
MEQTKSTRNKSYGVIRDILDNADSKGSAISTAIYIAATPDTFKSEKGFPEYDALRSRLMNIESFVIPGFTDWRAVIIDLSKAGLERSTLEGISKKIIRIHSIARDWNPFDTLDGETLESLINNIESGHHQVSKPRLLAAVATHLLEVAEQNRNMNFKDAVGPILNSVKKQLTQKPGVKEWSD